MKIAISYFTKSKKGNTKKLADAVAVALGIEARELSRDLPKKIDRLFLINAMYAANIDKEVAAFLERNKDLIGEIVNMNTSATGKSTLEAVSKAAAPLGIPVHPEEFHCKGSWLFLNKGCPTAEDLANAAAFAQRLAK